MRKTLLVLGLVAIAAFPACHRHRRPAPAEPSAPAAPATPPPAPAPPSRGEVVAQSDEYSRLKSASSDEIDRMGLFADVHFDYDKADLRDEDRAALSKNAEVLKKFDFLKVTVEGHCDERGTVEYNLALGERRARAAYDYVVSLGVPAERLKMVSYGKEIPLCQESNESCWSRNRRAHFAVSGKVH